MSSLNIRGHATVQRLSPNCICWTSWDVRPDRRVHPRPRRFLELRVATRPISCYGSYLPRSWTYLEGVAPPLWSYSPFLVLPPRISPTNRQMMQPCSSDWDETFLYLSREIFTPDIITTDLQQQVPTPPVCLGPFLQIFAMALTLLWS